MVGREDKRNMRPRILFVFDHKYENIWRDGLWAALELLKKDFVIDRWNLQNGNNFITTEYDFILGWGAFGSSVDLELRKNHRFWGKRGLCIAGNARLPYDLDLYEVLFYETSWYENQISGYKNKFKAFGINTDIYNNTKDNTFNCYKIWDYTTVGAFALWKRQEKLTIKEGVKLAIGEMQKDNLEESMEIIFNLLHRGVMVSDMVAPEKLADILNHTETLYIPADVNGGGERAILEGLACGCKVEVEDDNPKLNGLLRDAKERGVPDHKNYAEQLRKGILSCL